MKLENMFFDGDGVKRIKITPDVANEWLQNYRYSGQRNIANYNVMMLAKEILEGRFNEQTTICFVELQGKYFLVDGQHRLSAIVLSGKAVKSNVSVQSIESENDIGMSYATFDRQRRRGMGDALSMYNRDDIHLSNSQISHAGTGIRAIYSGFRHKAKNKMLTPIATVGLVQEWAEYASLYFASVDDTCNGKFLRKSVITGIGLITFRYSESQSVKFWEAIANDDGLRRGDPRKTCLEYILKYRRGGLSVSTNISIYEMALGITRAWEAFCKNEDLSIIRLYNKNSDIAIYGTPYNTAIEGYGIEAHKYFELEG